MPTEVPALNAFALLALFKAVHDMVTGRRPRKSSKLPTPSSGFRATGALLPASSESISLISTVGSR